MAVYYDKNKKCYYIRVKVGEKLHNCYSKPGTKGKFKKRAEAVEYEPIYMASILGERTVKAVIVNDDYLDGFYRFLRTKLKPSTYYGYVNTFDKYWRKKVMNIDVKNFNNTGLEPLVERVFAGKTNWNGKAASGKWFVKYMKKINPDLDPSLVVPPKVFAPSYMNTTSTAKTSSSNSCLSLTSQNGGSYSCFCSTMASASPNALGFVGAISKKTVSTSNDARV